MTGKPIPGIKIHKLFTYPGEADTVFNALQKVLSDRTALYVNYFIGCLHFLAVLIPAPGLRHIVEAHECQVNTWYQRQRAIDFLERICKARWSGQGCRLSDDRKKVII